VSELYTPVKTIVEVANQAKDCGLELQITYPGTETSCSGMLIPKYKVGPDNKPPEGSGVDYEFFFETTSLSEMRSYVRGYSDKNKN